MYSVLHAKMMQHLLEDDANKIKGYTRVKNELKTKLIKKKKQKQTLDEFLTANNFNKEVFKQILPANDSNREISKLLMNSDHFNERDFLMSTDSLLRDMNKGHSVIDKNKKDGKSKTEHEIRNYVKEYYDKSNKKEHGACKEKDLHDDAYSNLFQEEYPHDVNNIHVYTNKNSLLTSKAHGNKHISGADNNDINTNSTGLKGKKNIIKQPQAGSNAFKDKNSDLDNFNSDTNSNFYNSIGNYNNNNNQVIDVGTGSTFYTNTMASKHLLSTEKFGKFGKNSTNKENDYINNLNSSPKEMKSKSSNKSIQSSGGFDIGERFDFNSPMQTPQKQIRSKNYIKANITNQSEGLNSQIMKNTNKKAAINKKNEHAFSNIDHPNRNIPINNIPINNHPNKIIPINNIPINNHPNKIIPINNIPINNHPNRHIPTNDNTQNIIPIKNNSKKSIPSNKEIHISNTQTNAYSNEAVLTNKYNPIVSNSIVPNKKFSTSKQVNKAIIYDFDNNFENYNNIDDDDNNFDKDYKFDKGQVDNRHDKDDISNNFDEMQDANYNVNEHADNNLYKTYTSNRHDNIYITENNTENNIDNNLVNNNAGISLGAGFASYKRSTGRPKTTTIRMDYEDDMEIFNKVEGFDTKITYNSKFLQNPSHATNNSENQKPTKMNKLKSLSYDFYSGITNFFKTSTAFTQCITSCKKDKETNFEHSLTLEMERLKNSVIERRTSKQFINDDYNCINTATGKLEKLCDLPFFKNGSSKFVKKHTLRENSPRNNIIDELKNNSRSEERKNLIPKLNLEKVKQDRENILKIDTDFSIAKLMRKETLSKQLIKNNINSSIEKDNDNLLKDKVFETLSDENFENILRTNMANKKSKKDKIETQNILPLNTNGSESFQKNVEILNSSINHVFNINDNFINDTEINFKDNLNYINKNNSFIENDDKANFIDILSLKPQKKLPSLPNTPRNQHVLPPIEAPPVIKSKLTKLFPNHSSENINLKTFQKLVMKKEKKNTGFNNNSEGIYVHHLISEADECGKEQITFRNEWGSNCPSPTHLIKGSERNRVSRNINDFYLKKQTEEGILTQSSYDLLERGDKAIKNIRNKIINEDGKIIISTVVSRDESKKCSFNTDNTPNQNRLKDLASNKDLGDSSFKTVEKGIRKFESQENILELLSNKINKDSIVIPPRVKQVKKRNASDNLAKNRLALLAEDLRRENFNTLDVDTDRDILIKGLSMAEEIIPARSYSNRVDRDFVNLKHMRTNKNKIGDAEQQFKKYSKEEPWAENSGDNSPLNESINNLAKDGDEEKLVGELILEHKNNFMSKMDRLSGVESNIQRRRNNIPIKPKEKPKPSNIVFIDSGLNLTDSKRSWSNNTNSLKYLPNSQDAKSSRLFSQNSNSMNSKLKTRQDKSLSQFNNKPLSNYYSELENDNISNLSSGLKSGGKTPNKNIQKSLNSTTNYPEVVKKH
jgi:hypothetical protein